MDTGAERCVNSVDSDLDQEMPNVTTHLLRDLPSSPSSKISFPSCRLVLSIMAFLGFINVYCLRVNLSIAIVAMVNHTSVPLPDNSSSVGEECPQDVEPTNSSENSANHGGELNWDSNVQGTVLAAFFYGYITTQVLGGWLAERFGGKKLFGGGILITALLTLLTPFAARLHVGALIALRVLEGICEGVTFPSMHVLLSHWIPPLERSRAVTFIYAGAQIGTVIGMPVSGLLCDHGFAGGWPSVFYVFGIVGCVWSLAWFLLCHSTPAQHPRISAAERAYIESTLSSSSHSSRQPATPWCHIVTSRHVWACAAAFFANNWGYYMLLTCLPKYLNDVLHFNMSKSGLLAGAPYLMTWIMMTSGGQVADFLRAPHRLSTTVVRKIFCTIGLLLPATFLVIIGFLGCEQGPVVACVILSIGCSGLAMSGYGVNHLDLAPVHAGTLMGLTNMIGTVPGFAAPTVVGALTYEHSNRSHWQIAFYIATGIYGFGTVTFLLFGSGQQQEWGKLAIDAIETEVN